MGGQQLTVLPLLAAAHFGTVHPYLHLGGGLGGTKAGANLFAGTLSVRYGRVPVLLH